MCLESDWQGCHKTVQTECVCTHMCVHTLSAGLLSTSPREKEKYIFSHDKKLELIPINQVSPVCPYPSLPTAPVSKLLKCLLELWLATPSETVALYRLEMWHIKS